MLNIRLLAGVEGLVFGVSMFFFMLGANGGPEGLRSRQMYMQEARRYHGSQSDHLDEMHSEYTDLVGFLTVEGTNIDYPVMQGIDNSHYLNTDPFGAYSLSGSIFLDSRSSPDFSDEYSVIYGHHMDYEKCSALLMTFLMNRI
jgi:SrtB family sortase